MGLPCHGAPAKSMPHLSALRRSSKTSKRPSRPYEKERLDEELKLCGFYGLKNKREVYRQKLVLSKLRQRARDLLKLDEKDPKRLSKVVLSSVVSTASEFSKNLRTNWITCCLLRFKISWSAVFKLKYTNWVLPNPFTMLVF